MTNEFGVQDDPFAPRGFAPPEQPRGPDGRTVEEVRGSDYQSEAEREWYLNQIGQTVDRQTNRPRPMTQQDRAVVAERPAYRPTGFTVPLAPEAEAQAAIDASVGHTAQHWGGPTITSTVHTGGGSGPGAPSGQQQAEQQTSGQVLDERAQGLQQRAQQRTAQGVFNSLPAAVTKNSRLMWTPTGFTVQQEPTGFDRAVSRSARAVMETPQAQLARLEMRPIGGPIGRGLESVQRQAGRAAYGPGDAAYLPGTGLMAGVPAPLRKLIAESLVPRSPADIMLTAAPAIGMLRETGPGARAFANVIRRGGANVGSRLAESGPGIAAVAEMPFGRSAMGLPAARDIAEGQRSASLGGAYKLAKENRLVGAGERTVETAGPLFKEPAQAAGAGAPPPRRPPTAGPPIPPDDFEAAKVAVLRAVKEEENLRKVGTAGREIAAGRTAQAGGIQSQLAAGEAAGLSGEQLAQQAHSGAAVGQLRETIAGPVSVTPEQKAALFDEATRQLKSGDLREFDYLRATKALSKALAGETGLQPGEAVLLRQVYGDELSTALSDRAATVATARQSITADAKEIAAARAWQEKQAQQFARQAQRAEQVANDATRRAYESQDAAVIRNATRLRDNAIKAAADAQEAELRDIRRYNEAALLKQEKAAQVAQQRATTQEARLAETRDTQATKALDVARAAEQRAFERGDAAEIVAARRATAQAEAQVEREALGNRNLGQMNPEQRATEEQRRLQEALDKASPNYDMLMRKTEELAKAQNVPNAAALIKYVTDADRLSSARLKDPGALGRLTSALRASITRDLKDSYLTSVVRRTENLRAGLIEDGIEPDIASAIANGWRDSRIQQRFRDKVPTWITDQLATMKSAPYGDSWSGMDKLIQRSKNQIFSTDVGVIGIQLKAAIDRGGVSGFAGYVNRTLAMLHLPNAELYSVEVNLPKKIRNIADGLHYGLGPSSVEPSQGTLMSYAFDRMGKPGAFLDNAVEKAMDWSNRVQFGTILGHARDIAYEGNLVMLKLFGRDIENPIVRRVASDFANVTTSFGDAALQAGRSGWERKLFNSAPMVRSEVANLLQMSKLLRPGAMPEERILAASLIASRVASVFIVGKAINDVIGTGDLQMDPSKKGFGQVTTRFKDTNGKRVVIQLFPQTGIQRAFAQSIRALAEGNRGDLFGIWARAGSGRTTAPFSFAQRTVGVGYDEQSRFHLGDLGRYQTPGQRAASIARGLFLPPILHSQIAENPGLAVQALQAFGANSFNESDYAASARELRENLRTSTYTDVNGRRTPFPTTYVDAKGKVQQIETPADLKGASPLAYDEWNKTHPNEPGNDPRFQRVAELKDQFIGTPEKPGKLMVNDTLLDVGNPLAWRTQRSDLRNELRIRTDEALHGLEEKEPRTLLDVVNRHYSALIDANTDGKNVVNWDAVDRGIANWSAEEQRLLYEQRLAGETAASQQYIRDLKIMEPYFDKRDAAWADVVKNNPNFGVYKTYDDFRLARINDYATSQKITRTVAAPFVDKLLAPIESQMGQNVTAFLSGRADIVKLLDKYGYSVPAILRPLTLPASTGAR